MMTLEEQKVEGSRSEGVLNNLCTALNQLQPTYVPCPEAKPSCQTACLIKAGKLLNIWLKPRTHADRC
jgi:hypothetical protein